MAIGTRSDENKVLLGCPRKGPEVVQNYPYDGEAAVAAGVAVSLNSDGEVQAGPGNFIVGISRGVSMNHADRNSVTLRGKEVPLKLTDKSVAASLEEGDLTFTAKAAGAAGNDITVTFVDDGTAGSETVDVTGTDIVVHMDDTAETGSTATQIKAAIDGKAEAAALISVAIASGQGAVVQDDFVETALEGGVDPYEYVVPGAAVHVDDTTGLATSSGESATESNWKYASGALEGVSPEIGGSSADCALVDMAGL